MALSKPRRLDHLDSIRGIASLIVLIAHVWGMNADSLRSAHRQLGSAFFSFSDLLLYCLAKFEQLGRSAVILFFVLSGFVLTYSIRQSPLPYTGYAIKRVFRIYPTFAVAILISFTLHSLIGLRHVSESEWIRTSVDSTETFPMLLKTLLLWGTAGTHNLDGADWSLVHEMRVSLIFPLLLIFVTRFRSLSVFGFCALSLAVTEGSLLKNGTVFTGFEEASFVGTLFDTTYFLVFFAAGAYLALDYSRIATIVSQFPYWLKGFLFAVAAFTFLKTDTNLHSASGCVVDYLRGVGSVIVIALSFGVRGFRITLEHRLPIWLGRISYSLYLIHLPIIYVAGQFTFGWPPLWIGIATIALSLICATVMAEVIEFPSIKIGKKLSAWILEFSRNNSRAAA